MPVQKNLPSDKNRHTVQRLRLLPDILQVVPSLQIPQVPFQLPEIMFLEHFRRQLSVKM